MKFFISILIIFQGFLMGAVLENVLVNDKNISLIYEKSSNLPIVTMQIIFRNAGSIKDSKSGLAKLSAKILNEGTERDGSVKFAEKLESKAISLSANAGLETFVLEISSLKSEFKRAIELLIELLKNPNLTQSSFEKIKTLTLGNLSRKENDYDYIASIALNREIFKNSFLESPQSGDVESVNSIELKDIKEFLKNSLILDNSIGVIGGDIELSEAKSYISEVLKNLESKPTEIEITKIDAVSEKKTIKSVKPDTKQAYIYFGAPYYVDVSDEDSYISKVASFILGSSGFGSRMMEEIRVKRGLAYSAYSRVTLNKSYSAFNGYLQTKLENQDEAIKVVKEIIDDFIKNGVTQKELDSAKKFLLGSEPLRNETLSQRLSKTFLEHYRGFEIGYSKKELENISNLTLESLNKFIKNHKEINELTFSIVTNK